MRTRIDFGIRLQRRSSWPVEVSKMPLTFWAIRKHYAKWSTEYQRRTVDIMSRVHGTYTAREDFRFANPLNATDMLVLEEGVEPSCPVKGAGF